MSDQCAVELQQADGSFRLQGSRLDVSACGFSSDRRHEALAVADLDGDGTLDLVAGIGAYMRFFKGTGPLTFAPAVADTGANWESRLFVGRVPGRSHDELLTVIARPETTDVYRYPIDPAQGVGEAQLVATLPGGHAPSAYSVLYGFALSDFNGDAMTDVMVIGNQSYVSGPTRFAVACDRGSTWQIVESEFPPDTRILRPVDLDEDGTSEVMARVGTDIVFYGLD